MAKQKFEMILNVIPLYNGFSLNCLLISYIYATYISFSFNSQMQIMIIFLS